MNPRPNGFRDFIKEQGFHSLYLVTTTRDTPVKVGIAQDPLYRLAGLQNANFDHLRIHRFWWLPGRPIAARLERSFKEYFAPAAVRGEWFDVSLTAAEGFVEDSIRSIGTWGISQEEMATLMAQWEHRLLEKSLARITPGHRFAQRHRVSSPVSRLLR